MSLSRTRCSSTAASRLPVVPPVSLGLAKWLDDQRPDDQRGNRSPPADRRAQANDIGKRNRGFEATDLINAFTELERQLAGPDADTRTSPRARTRARPAALTPSSADAPAAES